ncbi:hypothetical protein [Bacillus mojavensis]
MAKHRKKPVVVEAKLFEMGMEDGYACYPVFSDKLIGYFYKDGVMPKSVRKPAIKTLEGWYEVEVGKHYIVTGVKGERYPVEKEIFEETYEKVEE